MSSNNQEITGSLINFTNNGSVFITPIGNDIVYHFIGTFDGATVYVEECGMNWEDAGFGKGADAKSEWLADTSVPGLWTAVLISGVPIELTAPSGSNYINTPKKFVRFRCDGAGVSTDIIGRVTYFKP